MTPALSQLQNQAERENSHLRTLEIRDPEDAPVIALRAEWGKRGKWIADNSRIDCDAP